MPVWGDLREEQEVSRIVSEIRKNWERIDILVCCAGGDIGAGGTGVGKGGRPENDDCLNITLDDLHSVMDRNLLTTLLCCREVAPEMIERNYGRILCTSSIAGKEGNPLASAYSAAKAGVIALVKSLGKELADYEISVNCMTPCTAATRILEQFSAEHIEYMRSKIPRGRFVTVEEIAAMAAWLVSEENSFTTGAVFDLSGGRATY